MTTSKCKNCGHELKGKFHFHKFNDGIGQWKGKTCRYRKGDGNICDCTSPEPSEVGK